MKTQKASSNHKQIRFSCVPPTPHQALLNVERCSAWCSSVMNQLEILQHVQHEALERVHMCIADVEKYEHRRYFVVTNCFFFNRLVKIVSSRHGE